KKMLEKFGKTLTGRAKAAHEKWKTWQQQQGQMNQFGVGPGGVGPGGVGPGGVGPGGVGPGGVGPGGVGPGGVGPGGAGPGRGMMMGPGRGGSGGNVYGGMAGSGFDSSAQRLEKAIEYIPLEELDTALTKGGKVPAMTVVPLRMVTIHAEIPYGKQLKEL